MRLIGRTMRPAQEMRRSRFEVGEAPADHVIFLGDSITEHGLWDEWFPELRLLNRGVGGETVEEVTARVPRTLPGARAVSVLVGTNDLTGFGRSRKVADIVEHYEELVAAIRHALPDAPVLLNSILPRDRLMAGRVRELNVRISEMAAAAGMHYVDAWSQLRGTHDQLRPEFTRDRIHLTGAGYQRWLKVLRPALAEALSATNGPST
ncbi:GDSL-type esterase/lipase family protein [Leifsonia sp. NPDC056665]|uniref:GDSL-type esterase/lipase family protein n=1 Tax=Leifsonia sp. NPDC056665 TaxID=3345901 RepID=UPI0036B69817